MIPNKVHALKPKRGKLGKDGTFEGNCIRENTIERADPIRRDEQEVLPEVKDLPHLSRGNFADVRKIERKNVHDGFQEEF
jgi:hypothetical protein